MKADSRFAPIVVPEPGRHPLHTMLAHIDAAARPDGWDQPTRLYLLDRVAVGAGAGIGVIEWSMTGACEPLGRLHPRELLNGIGRYFQANGVDKLPAGWCGFGIVCETWGVDFDHSDPDATSSAVADALAHRLGERPDAYEIRFAMAATTFGHEGTLSRCRGRGPDGADRITFTPKLHPAWDVAAALKRLMREVARAR